MQQLKCQACGKQFSGRFGTALYRLHTSTVEVAQALLAFNLGLSVVEVQLLFGHSDVTLRTWLTRAGIHGEKVHQHFFRNLSLGHLQLDELYTTLRDKTQDVWIWVALDPKSKLIPALCVGPRTQDMAYALIHTVVTALAPGCLPVCTSDGLNLYFICVDGSLWHLAHRPPVWQTPVAGRVGTALWSGEESLPAPPPGPGRSRRFPGRP